MRSVWLAAFMVASVAGSAEAQYRDRYAPPPPPSYGGREDYREAREDARDLMHCAGYMAYIRVNVRESDWFEDKLESLEVQFTRESDRISNSDPRRSRWFQRGGEEARDDLQRYRRDSLRDRVREKRRECRRIMRQ